MWQKPLERGLTCVVGMSLVASMATALPSCGSSEKNRPKAIEVQPAVVRDVPQVLRGMIGSEADIRGVQPILVSGYGLVVGLNGTGGDVLPDSIAATMEREMGLKGIGRGSDYAGSAINGKSPREMLRDPNTAVVLVQAAIPPGSPAGSSFDVYVTAINASSLEGGSLWTTDLRLGPAQSFGGVQARTIASARGPVFINPFSNARAGNVTSTTGRILDGGTVTAPFDLEVLMDNTSHTRARSVVSAINSRFPEGPGDIGTTARGRTGSSIELRVPTRYRREAGNWLNVIRNLQIDQSFPEEYARTYVDALKAEPAYAEQLSWALEGVGPKALPFLRELYDYPELAPQMAALKAGARLNDPMAAQPLRDLSKRAEGTVRTQAISFLGELDAGPRVDAALRELLDEDQLIIRVAAYEALAKRAERAQFARLRTYQMRSDDINVRSLPITHVEALSRRSLSSALQGVQRRQIAGKFFLDRVPGGAPLIYITQQGEPKIVLFGEDPKLPDLITPFVVSVWSNRLLLASDDGASIRVRYEDTRGNTTTGVVKANLTELIDYMARSADATGGRPGLGMSYSEVVASLYSLSQQGATRAAFATESDRLQAQILAAQSSRDLLERPETKDDRELIMLTGAKQLDEMVPKRNESQTPTIVPIEPPAKEK